MSTESWTEAEIRRALPTIHLGWVGTANDLIAVLRKQRAGSSVKEHEFKPLRRMVGRRMVNIDVCVASIQQSPESSRQLCRLPQSDPIHQSVEQPAEDCPHPDWSFDRTICGGCDSMPDVCVECGWHDCRPHSQGGLV